MIDRLLIGLLNTTFMFSCHINSIKAVYSLSKSDGFSMHLMRCVDAVFTVNIWLHIFILTYMCLDVTTNVL